MIIDKAICRKCGELTDLAESSDDYLYHGLIFVCEHCRVTNHVIVRGGSVAIPNAFREAFRHEQLHPDNFKNEQSLTIRIMVRSQRLSDKVLKEALIAVFYFVGTSVVGYLHSIFRFHGSDHPEKDFSIEFEKELDS